MDEKRPCPICTTPIEKYSMGPKGDIIEYSYSCPICGDFMTNNSTEYLIEREIHLAPLKSAVLSHVVRKMQAHSKYPIINEKIAEQILNNNLLPTPAEQAENLIIWLGDTLESPGEIIQLHVLDHFRAIIGAASRENFILILDHLVNDGIIRDDRVGPGPRLVTLTFEGWQRYEELKRGASQSRKAFMAMPFGDERLDKVFQDYFKPAVDQTGFNLVRLDEQPKAGSIDDHIRLEILTSRFLVSDLTNGNHGAYWEAGYAEGLGKPVIYTCEKSYFDDRGTHFDTSHLTTVLWDFEDLSVAAEDLKVTIRTTLPEEAKLIDD